MGNDDTLNTTFWLMIVLQTIGSVDMPGSGPRKLPSPRAYVATVTLWALLNVFAGGNRRLAERFSWFVVLVGAVVGPFGQRMVSLLNTVAGSAPQTPTIGSNTSNGAKQ